MVREIKVRGWHTTQKRMYSAEEMALDQLTLLPTGNFINVSGSLTILSVIYPSDKFIPLQYTGLKDKNGWEVYEGDIIKRGFGDYHYKIIWHYNLSSWYMEGIQTGNSGVTRGDMALMCEVVGNVYENPELLN